MNDINIIRRPRGVTLIAIYTAIGAAFSLLVGVPQLLTGETTAVALITGVVYSILGTLFMVTVYGLWTLKTWGYKLARGIYAVSVVFGCFSLFSNLTLGNIITQGITIAIAIWILSYLRKEEPMDLFGIKS